MTIDSDNYIDLSDFWRSLATSDIDDTSLELTSSASVLIAITSSMLNPEVILTLRAKTMSTHSGQVAFPGGRWELQDSSLVDTAIRESQEEIALLPSHVEVKGRLRERQSLHGLTVYPFVAQVPHDVELVADPVETETVFRVPLRFFLESEPARIDKVERQDVRYQMPAWYFENYEIWGLTAYFLQDMLTLMKKHIKLESVSPSG